jgi:DNA-binding response OmpR family regulator
VKRILAVDDDPNIRSFLKRGLSYEGYFFGDENVVEVYVKLLRQKLEAEGESRLVYTIRNVGYVLRGT